MVILCLERCFSKQNSVIHRKSSILSPPKILGWLRHCLLHKFESRSVVEIFRVKNIHASNLSKLRVREAEIGNRVAESEVKYPSFPNFLTPDSGFPKFPTPDSDLSKTRTKNPTPTPSVVRNSTPYDSDYATLIGKSLRAHKY